jgi:uncharacterized protein (TIRG00374 family)
VARNVEQVRPRFRRSSLWSQPSRAKLFGTAGGEARAHRPADAFVLLASILALLAVVKTSTPPSTFWSRSAQVATSLPGFFDILWRTGLWVLSGWALFLVAAPLVRKRLDILRDELLALVGAGIAILVVEAAVGGTARSLWAGTVAGGPPSDPVSARLGFAVAAIATISPYLARPNRALGWWLMAGGAVSAAAVGVAAPGGVVLGFLCGTSAAATVHLVFGSSGGRPSLAEVRKGLGDLGVPVRSLSGAPTQEAGVFVVDAADADGARLLVKAYGRDAWDTELLAKAWRAVWYRDSSALSLSRLQQVEHEGFLTLLAARNGVPTQDVVHAGRTADNDALIVMRVRGAPLAIGVGAANDDVVEAVWDTVLALAAAGLVHGDLHPGAFWFDGGQAVIGNMARASVAINQDQRRVDLAQLLTLSATFVSPERALAVARRRLGPDELAAVVPYIQKAAFGARLREAVAQGGLDIDDLRARAAAVAGSDAPKMARVRRVSTRALVQTGLLVAAAYFLISNLANVDVNQLLDALRSASLPLLLLALIVAQLPRFCYAESTRAACPRPLAYGPVVLLQFTVAFINLVLPSSVARMALDIRFFQRQGIPPTSAVSISLIDNFATYTVQIFIISAALIFGFGHIDLDLRASSHRIGGLLLVLAILIGLVVLLAIIAIAVPPVRKRVLDNVRPHLEGVRETVAALRSPTKIIRLLLSNLGAEVLLASTLGVVLVSLGTSLSLATLLVVNVGVSFFAGLIPVPGGIGVTEGALVVGLTAAGLDQATAFAAAICYRLCTYYLPPIIGWFTMRRLEKTGLL